jgi:hypothetical protein
MPTDPTQPASGESTGRKANGPPTPAAERALAEAAARRAAFDRTAEKPKEVSGPAGPEPTRYGDWEINGIASDF